MWRALSICTGDLVLYLDGDSGDFGPHFVTGTLGPLLTVPGVAFVKGFYRRPFGGRAGRRRARHRAHRPPAAAPLLARPRRPPPAAGGGDGRRARAAVLDPVPTGYAVETAMLLDIRARVGASAIAQVDLEQRRNDHQSLTALAAMADEVLAAACARLGLPGERPLERPPMADVLAAAA